jgi:hypothetical protein
MADCVDGLGKHLEFSESWLRFERETFRRGFWATTCMLIYMIDYWVGGENITNFAVGKLWIKCKTMDDFLKNTMKLRKN